MKNLHLIETDKPSRLYEGNLGELVIIQYNSPLKSLHIYITSDEEIKEGDWVLNIEENKTFKPSNDEIYDIKNSEAKYHEYCKKIILTTDQDLIGVQAIDDDFLEWFVKNPSCEEVMVYKDERLEPKQDFQFYEIMYALSEPLQETLENLYCKECNKNLEICTCMDDTIDMKQETLEEAAERYANHEIKDRGNDSDKLICSIDFIEGAKWQAEKMYSEEDLREAIKFGLNGMYGYQFDEEGETENQISKYLQQFLKTDKP